MRMSGKHKLKYWNEDSIQKILYCIWTSCNQHGSGMRCGKLRFESRVCICWLQWRGVISTGNENCKETNLDWCLPQHSVYCVVCRAEPKSQTWGQVTLPSYSHSSVYSGSFIISLIKTDTHSFPCDSAVNHLHWKITLKAAEQTPTFIYLNRLNFFRLQALQLLCDEPENASVKSRVHWLQGFRLKAINVLLYETNLDIFRDQKRFFAADTPSVGSLFSSTLTCFFYIELLCKCNWFNYWWYFKALIWWVTHMQMHTNHQTHPHAGLYSFVCCDTWSCEGLWDVFFLPISLSKWSLALI